LLFCAFALAALRPFPAEAAADYPIQFVPVKQVQVEAAFWSPAWPAIAQSRFRTCSR
jgi:hypothetical protein